MMYSNIGLSFRETVPLKSSANFWAQEQDTMYILCLDIYVVIPGTGVQNIANIRKGVNIHFKNQDCMF